MNNKPAKYQPSPRLYLLCNLDHHFDPNLQLEQLEKRANILDIACLCLRGSLDRFVDDLPKFIKSVQGYNIAVVLENNELLARQYEADGVHLNFSQIDAHINKENSFGESYESERYQLVRSVMGNDSIVGVELVVSSPTIRHTAMELGERGCDYVAFASNYNYGREDNNEVRGELQSASTNNNNEHLAETQQSNFDQRYFDLMSWWSELFQTPCVAWNIDQLNQIEDAVKSGADFLALTPDFWAEEDVLKRLQPRFAA